MTMVCTIAVLFFCLTPRIPGSVDIHFQQTIAVRVTLSGQGWRADYSGGDIMAPLETAGMAQACKDGQCVSYSRQCQKQHGKDICDLTLNEYDHADKIRFTADNDDQMHEAFGSLGYIRKSSSGEPTVVIPFALFKSAAP